VESTCDPQEADRHRCCTRAGVRDDHRHQEVAMVSALCGGFGPLLDKLLGKVLDAKS
jgi:hypothetical protein